MGQRVAALVDEPGLAPTARLERALERVGLAERLARAAEQAGAEVGDLRVVVLPELAGFAVDAPTYTDPVLVEHLIDCLHDAGCAQVTVAGSPDSSALWAGNRDVLALADLLGYRFTTPGGRDYDIADLSEDLTEADFAPGGVLTGAALSRVWLDADLRVVFTKNRSDEADGYALCLDTLLGALPLVDEDYHYRLARHPGDVVAELLERTPVGLALIDAVVSCHGSGGTRAPKPLETGCVLAAGDPWTADHVGALAMGLDPAASRLARRSPLTGGQALAELAVQGQVRAHAGWQAPHPLLTDATRRRDAAASVARLVRPWLQVLDPELFPLASPLDAKANARLAPLFADVDEDPAAFALLVFANATLAGLHEAVQAYRTMYDKDAVHRVQVPLGLDLDAYTNADYDAIMPELAAVERLGASAPERADGLRWREVDGATVFAYTRVVPVDYDEFVAAVDVARTIQHMNDYLGGVIVPVDHDEQGRVRRQAERNVYLPQPNYLALAQGKPIDVAKLEVVAYDDDHRRMYWKTVVSPNGSAVHDDGVVTFARATGGTEVTIAGRQQFVLPPFWQAVDLDLVPQLKAHLVTDAYRRFFDRTVANFEALVEGRDIRIGRPWQEPASPWDTAALPAAVIEQRLEDALDWLGRWRRSGLAGQDSPGGRARQAPGHQPVAVDEDGFAHFAVTPAGSLGPTHRASAPPDPESVPGAQPAAAGAERASPLAGLTEFWSGLAQALIKDSQELWERSSP